MIASVALTAGTTYYIVVEKFGSARPAAGNTAVQVRMGLTAPPPPNDQCREAEVIPPAGPFPHLSATLQDVRYASSTGDPPPPLCQSNVYRSVWYAFTPLSRGSYDFSLCADAPTATTADDTVLSVFVSSDGTCGGTLAQVTGGCDDDSCGSEATQSRIDDLVLAPRTTYLVLAHQYGNVPPPPGGTAVQLRVGYDGPPTGDADGDGLADAADRAPADPTTWRAPGAASDLEFAADGVDLAWAAPADPGSTVVRYDQLRAADPDGFIAASCLVVDSPATTAVAPQTPGSLFAYLVRSGNGCGSSLGTDSQKQPRAGAPCP